MALSVEYFYVRKLLFVSKGANIIHRWGSSDDVAGCVWGIPKFRDIPLGFVRVPSSGFLGLVTSGLSNLQRGILFVF